ncbi:MAG: PD-(D/E)XK nuclease domain-containing protein [Deltaproteobacteria bacterium]|nr:PD-(D/E)XK nuclease domain-containing protein [Deltaproteobacteria bacterium]
MDSFYHKFYLSFFRIFGCDTNSERKMSKGIIDLVITTPKDSIMITEIKYAKSNIKTKQFIV